MHLRNHKVVVFENLPESSSNYLFKDSVDSSAKVLNSEVLGTVFCSYSSREIPTYGNSCTLVLQRIEVEGDRLFTVVKKLNP